MYFERYSNALFLWFGRIRFDTISVWTNVSLKCHARVVQKEKATIGRWAVVSYWTFNICYNLINSCRLILFDFANIWKIDAHYEEMFENGNFRRRRRMKRTYNRTSAAHISRLYDSPYNPNYSSTARMYANPSYRYSYPDPA